MNKVIILSIIVAALALLLVILYCNLKKQKQSYKILLDQSENLNNLSNELKKLQQSKKDLLEEQQRLFYNFKSQAAEYGEKEKQILVEYKELQSKRDKISVEIKQMSQQLKELKNSNQTLKQVNNSLLSKIDKEYEEKLIELQEHYNEQAELYEKQLIDNKQKVQATIQVAINNYEKEQEINFYRLQIPQKDLEDIKLIRSIENKINHKEVLGKIIYKVYLEKPTNDLINRIIGKTDICGIYKITNLSNQMCYVGQSVNIKKRWVQHIKRAINAETRTKNKLYPAMDEFGIENFSFELIDQCDKDKLNSREQYWQDYYSAKTFGYSIK